MSLEPKFAIWGKIMKMTTRANYRILTNSTFAIRDTRTAWCRDRPVRIGPRFSKFCCSWFGPVRDLEIFLGPGPVRSQVSKFFQPVVVRGSLASMMRECNKLSRKSAHSMTICWQKSISVVKYHFYTFHLC